MGLKYIQALKGLTLEGRQRTLKAGLGSGKVDKEGPKC